MNSTVYRSDPGYFDLAIGIVKQAADDYVKDLVVIWSGKAQKLKPEEAARLMQDKAEIEAFFHSPWYECLTDVDGDRILTECRRKAEEKVKKMIIRENQKKIKKLMKGVKKK